MYMYIRRDISVNIWRNVYSMIPAVLQSGEKLQSRILGQLESVARVGSLNISRAAL